MSKQCHRCGAWKWERDRPRKRGDPILPPWRRDKDGLWHCPECAKIKNVERITAHQNTRKYTKRIISYTTGISPEKIPDVLADQKLEQLKFSRQLKEIKHVIRSSASQK